jgi:hypothetical protein
MTSQQDKPRPQSRLRHRPISPATANDFVAKRHRRSISFVAPSSSPRKAAASLEANRRFESIQMRCTSSVFSAAPALYRDVVT